VDFDLEPYFKRYEALLQMADDVFARMKREFPDEVRCRTGCADCCYALFDLTVIEALYINQKFQHELSADQKERLLEKANRADRSIHKIKKTAYKELKAGKSENEILTDLAKERIRCPLLNDQELCDLYRYRPITCRFYGVPTCIGGAGHTCGESGFQAGQKYPTVNLDLIHQKLHQLSSELVQDMKSKHVNMADMLVPLSMALLTDYTEEYLGISSQKAGDEPKGGSSD